jgi:peptidoglycan/xylan/chitin deacetylase (PgdA/CDA1 family)
MIRITRTPRIIQRFFPGMTWGFSLDSAAVYLTFDDGPDPELTGWVLDTLKDYEAKATFFCVGDRVRQYPEVLKRIMEEGHAVGNHTMSHENGFTTDDKTYIASIQEAANVIPSKLFRPPYGRIKPSQAKALRSNDFRIIMWSWLTYDFDHGHQVDKVLRQVNGISAGDIIVLHDNPKCADRMKQILPAILAEVNRKGLICKAISEPISA